MNDLKGEEVQKEAELELICDQCGLCCHHKVPLSDGTFVIHPNSCCEHLSSQGTCDIYKDRFTVNPACLSRDQMIAKDYVLPPSCPYIELRRGYKPARIVDEDEFNRLMALELYFRFQNFEE